MSRVPICRVIIALTLCCMGLSLQAQTSALPELARLLLPITVHQSEAAYGSRWSADLQVVHRDGSFEEDPFDRHPRLRFPCAWPCIDTSLWIYTPGRPERAGFYRTLPGETGGGYLYVLKAGLAAYDAKLFVREARDTSVPVEIPVVREDEFSARAIFILDVWPSSTARVMLRLYGHDPAGGGVARVRVFNQRTGALVTERTVQLTVTQLVDRRWDRDLPMRPPYAEIPDPVPASVRDPVWFEITPAAPLRLWAFATITDNATNQFLVRTSSALAKQ